MEMYEAMKLRYFKFGVDISPWWFLKKVDNKEVEYTYEYGRIQACRFYSPSGKEITKNIGDMITIDMLYKETPTNAKPEVEAKKYRHYQTSKIEGREY